MSKDENSDPESSAVSAVVAALVGLQADAQQRVLRYVADRFNATLPGAPKPASASPPKVEKEIPANTTEFADVGELVEQAAPSDGRKRALVVGYWFQVCQAQESFSGKAVNDELKSLGHPAANITTVMNGLKAKKPALIQQLSKTGKAQQARKTYRLTKAGIAAVNAMLSGQGVDDEG